MDDRDQAQSEGRVENAAKPKPPGTAEVRPEAYPEARRFNSQRSNPAPRQGAGDGSATAANEGRQGPQADPAEGKR